MNAERNSDAISDAEEIERNAADFLMRLGRATGGEQLERDDLEWTIGGSPIDYLAALDGAPVGTGTLHLTAHSAGIYFVFTVPPARRRGVGAAITRAMVRDARSRGAHLAVRCASGMGRPLYARLGFREVCTIRIFTAAP